MVESLAGYSATVEAIESKVGDEEVLNQSQVSANLVFGSFPNTISDQGGRNRRQFSRRQLE